MPVTRRTFAKAAVAAGGLAATTAAGLRHPVFGGTPRGARLARMQASPQWDAARSRFANTEPSAMGGSLSSAWEWVAGGSDHRRPEAPVPVVSRRRADYAEASPFRLTWLGHATTLVELGGRRLLIDPVFSRHASPGPLFGVARFHAPPVALAELPPLDAVLLTHDHYDHLDRAAVETLAPTVPRWLAPLGVGAHLERWGVAPERVEELDWWDEADVGGVRAVATPARHFSGRSLTDRDRTLWCGWALLADAGRLWASGDGGYTRHFGEIGRRLGPFDASLVEVGAYDQSWADIHMGPEQGVRAVQDVGGGVMLPVHWGTFDLALHGWTEPAERVVRAAEAAGVPVAVPRPGAFVEPLADVDRRAAGVERWWPELPFETAEEAPVVSSGVAARAAAEGRDQPGAPGV